MAAHLSILVYFGFLKFLKSNGVFATQGFDYRYKITDSDFHLSDN